MKEKEIKPLSLAEVIGSRKYSLDVLLMGIVNDALTNASLEGLQFVRNVLDLAKGVDFPDAKKSMKMAFLLFNQLTPEQIAELKKQDE